MNIQASYQDVVTRHVEGETLASIGRGYDRSREWARQMFNLLATEDDRKKAHLARMPHEPEDGPDDPDFPKGEKRIRVNVPAARNSDITQREVRAGIARWIAGEFDISLTTRGAKRFGPVMAESMHVKLSVRCTSQNIPIATAVRGIIAYLENENAQG